MNIFFLSFILLVTLLIIWYTSREGFANKQEKSAAIVNWFDNNPKPSYTKFRRDLGGKSNIVEYEDALGLRHYGKLSVEKLKKIL
jgi:hypothetical protein